MGKRTAITGPGIPEHPQPFPPAVKVGNMIFSAAINGQDAATGNFPKGQAEQIALAFANMGRIVEAGGGKTGDIAKVTVHLKDRKDRDLVNIEWEKMFPHANDRPVRHTVASELPSGRFIQLELIAVL